MRQKTDNQPRKEKLHLLFIYLIFFLLPCLFGLVGVRVHCFNWADNCKPKTMTTLNRNCNLIRFWRFTHSEVFKGKITLSFIYFSFKRQLEKFPLVMCRKILYLYLHIVQFISLVFIICVSTLTTLPLLLKLSSPASVVTYPRWPLTR